MALENATFREAWTTVRRTISANREAFFSYFVLRLLLPLIATVVLFVAASIVLLIVFGILGMSAAGFNAMLEDATGAGAYFLMGLNTLFVLLGLGIGYGRCGQPGRPPRGLHPQLCAAVLWRPLQGAGRDTLSAVTVAIPH